MSDTREAIERELEQRLAEKLEQDRLLSDTRALLERVDERRRSRTSDRRRWDDRARVLEEAFAEGRRRLGRIEQSITDLSRKLDGLRSATPDSPALADDLPVEAPQPIVDGRRRAAELILSAPVFRLEHLALEDFALAKAFLESPDARTMAREQRDELVRRVGVYDRRLERDRLSTRPRPTIEERRQQVLLRQVIDKCRAGSFASLTLGEIDLLIHSYDLLMQQAKSAGDEDRLVELINRAVDEICARWISLDRLRLALRSLT